MRRFLEIVHALRSWVMPVVALVAVMIAARWFQGFSRVTSDKGYSDLTSIPEDDGMTLDPVNSVQTLRSGDVLCYQISEGDIKSGFGVVIALPGDVVGVAGAKVCVNGKPHDLGALTPGSSDREGLPVPAEHVYVLSDYHHYDSLAYGPVPLRSVKGRVRGGGR